MIVPSHARRSVGAVFAAGLVAGIGAAIFYGRLGLTLSHYDARGHLIVARRIFDNITPGWEQIGAIWLPLPHLLNAIPVQVDAFYRTGASGVAISIVSFAAAAASIAWIVALLTESVPAAIAGALVFGLNANVVYLQATPMTEPLLMALTLVSVAMLLEWTSRSVVSKSDESVRAAGVVIVLACMTRYEAWPITYMALAAVAWALVRQGQPIVRAARQVARLALYPTLAIILFTIYSRVVVGSWFPNDFYVPENRALGKPYLAASEIVWGTRELSGPAFVALAAAGLLVLIALGVFVRRKAHFLIPVSLCAAAAVPWYAFVDGHPFRIRYMVPLIALEGVTAGVLAGLAGSLMRRAAPSLRRADLLPAVLVAGVAIAMLRPLDTNAAMVVEAQWDRPNKPLRQLVTNCLRARYDGTTVMASMGSLGHYMQEASHDGFSIRDFLHEGNGDIWKAAIEDPRPYAGWMLIEEKAEGGDMLAQKARENPGFLRGYSRVCEGAGLVLYERQNRMLNVKR